MFKEIIQKCVTICMRNGAVLEGFVTDNCDGFVRIIELDNSVVILNLEDISFLRLGLATSEDIKQEFVQEENHKKPPMFVVQKGKTANEFSMPTPTPDEFEEGPYKKPKFVRSTKNDDLD
jgi:hypothetical protein